MIPDLQIRNFFTIIGASSKILSLGVRNADQKEKIELEPEQFYFRQGSTP